MQTHSVLLFRSGQGEVRMTKVRTEQTEEMMLLTLFAMYATHAPGGVMHTSLGFMYSLFSLQGMRLAHHFGLWLIFGFLINHIYSAWLMDIKERGGEISSMFSGYMFTVKEKE